VLALIPLVSGVMLSTVAACGETVRHPGPRPRPGDGGERGCADEAACGGSGGGPNGMGAAPAAGSGGEASTLSPNGGAAGQFNAGGMSAADDGAAGESSAGDPLADREWATWPMPSWAESGLPNLPRYTDLGDGTVRDDITGLVWRRVRASTLPWSSALVACDPDFRLPSIIELVSLANPETGWVDPVLEQDVGGGWSSSPVAGTTDRAWLYYGGNGSTYPWSASASYRALCVKAGFASAQPHYELTNVGATVAVRDNWTGLVWQQVHSARPYEFGEAQAYCATLGAGFRVPSSKELQTLVDRRRFGPAIDAEYFPNTPSERFWSGTRVSEFIAHAVEFQLGASNTYGTEEAYYVRCVY
jgi:hypothetical protein